MKSIQEADRLRFEPDLEATLQAARGQGKRFGTTGEYDAAMGLSGGKDSTHLLYTLQEKYGLRVLPVAVDMGFMTKVAKDNIAQTAAKLGVDVVWRDDVAPLFIELYKWLFAHRLDIPANPAPWNMMLTGRVCPACSDLLEGFVIQEATRRHIPLVLFGLSPDQNARFTYEITPAIMGRSWQPDFVQGHLEDFSPAFCAAWWDPAQFPGIRLPRVLLPYHAWPYNESAVIATVEKLGLIPPKKADPLLTNCDVVWAFSVYDARVYGANMYAFPIARLVREGQADREKWKKIIREMTLVCQDGTFRGPAVRKFYNLLGISLKQVIALTNTEPSSPT